MPVLKKESEPKFFYRGLMISQRRPGRPGELTPKIKLTGCSTAKVFTQRKVQRLNLLPRVDTTTFHFRCSSMDKKPYFNVPRAKNET